MKDSSITRYQALEAFETFKRPSDMSIQSSYISLKKDYLKLHFMVVSCQKMFLQTY